MIPDIYIKRQLEKTIKAYFNKGKVIVIYGARQVGKTTLIKNLFPAGNKNTLYLACDQIRMREQLIPDSLAIKKIIGQHKNIIFDEAQYLSNPGLVLKILIDNFPERNVIATGSSAFDLAHKISEPLTGRHYTWHLYPFLLTEIASFVPATDIQFHLEQALIYGTYPGVFKLSTHDEKVMHLRTITDSYLYKDVLEFNLVKNSQKVRELLIALALQVGSEVSYTELGNSIGMDRKTVENYLDLLEKSFVIFRLYGFSRNLRSEMNRKVKIYFYDIGVRNALINNFNGLSLRTDGGAIFENFAIAELLKQEANKPQRANLYFWRTYEQKEIDLIAEKNGKLTAYEMKLHKPKKTTGFSAFTQSYPGTKTKVITINSLLDELKPRK